MVCCVDATGTTFYRRHPNPLTFFGGHFLAIQTA
jgi:hypothetical protein